MKVKLPHELAALRLGLVVGSQEMFQDVSPWTAFRRLVANLPAEGLDPEDQLSLSLDREAPSTEL